MKKILLTSLIAAAGLGLSAQNLDKVKRMVDDKKYTEAKTEIDKISENEKFQKNPDVWYNKAKVYAAIADSASFAANVPEAREIAFDALKKYVDMDTKQHISLQIDKFGPLMSIYSGFFQKAAADYNGKQYEQAFNNFVKAGEVSTLMSKKGWSNTVLDTTVILYTAVSAQNAKKDDEAKKYYTILTDAKVNSKGMDDCYIFLADYYSRKDDLANAQKYLALGQELFPTNPYWASMELDLLREKGDKPALFAKYEEVIGRNPEKVEFIYNYALELYEYGYKPDITQRPANSVELISKVESNLKKVLELQPDNHSAALVLGQVYYNKGVDHQNLAVAAKGTKPEEVKKRADEKALAIAQYDLAVPYLDQVQKKLSPMGKLNMQDRNALKNSLDLLIIVFDQKGQKEKMKEYELKYNNVDKDH